MARTLEGSWSTTASGRPSYEVFVATTEMIFPVLDLAATLGFTVEEGPMFGLDVVVTKIARDGVELHVGWDHWSGVYVFSEDEAGDDDVRRIAALLEPRLATEEWRKYVQEW